MDYDNFLETLSTPSVLSWSERDESAVMEPFTYITSAPGKDIRGKMIEAFNVWLNVPPEKLKTISRVVNMLHSASLM
jgi:geranylgeranyl diphosphate synthase, type III